LDPSPTFTYTIGDSLQNEELSDVDNFLDNNDCNFDANLTTITYTENEAAVTVTYDSVSSSFGVVLVPHIEEPLVET
jgi:hypothetical protein